VWNAFNRVPRQVYTRSTGTTRSMSSTTWEPYLNDASQQVLAVFGQVIEPVTLMFVAPAVSSGDNPVLGIGVDSTTVNSATVNMFSGTEASPSLACIAQYCDYPSAVGYHAFNLIERSAAGGSCTFYGADNTGGVVGCGASGTIWA
jgi:hypothetical protein